MYKKLLILVENADVSKSEGICYLICAYRKGFLHFFLSNQLSKGLTLKIA